MMKYLSASNKTLGFLNSLILLGTIYGTITYEFTIPYILLTILFYFIFSGLGVGMMLHRYYSHGSFEFKSDVLRKVLTYVSLLSARGSIIGWVYVHRMHHKHSDTENDPHIRNMKILNLLFPYFSDHGKSINKFVIKDLLNQEQLKINQHYMVIVLLPVAVLSIVSFKIAFFCWFLPVFLTHVIWNIFFWLGHHEKFGYRNFATSDKSSNSWLFAILTFGEGWHNNHHQQPKSYTTKVHKHEFDLIGSIILLLQKTQTK